jgi:aminopeptidase YwaD
MRLLLPAVFGAALCAVVLAAPREILVVSDSLHDTAARLGARSFGRTANHLLLEPSGPVRARLPGTLLCPEPHLPLFVVARPGGRAEGLVVLFRDRDETLVQAEEEAARLLARDGASVIQLPERPFALPEFAGRAVPRRADPDTFIQRIVARVSPDSIRARMARLQAFRTRYSPTDSCRAAEEYVCQYLRSLGLDSVALDPYPVGGDTWRNVVATRLGRLRPDKVLIVCGHMDAISEDPWNLAPGMEDNGSGTGVALEAARVLADVDLDYTVRFIAFTGEEIGLNGSDHYARQARSRGEDIICAFNFDMVSWPGGSWGISLVGVPQAAHFVLYEARMASLYTPLAHRVSFRSFPSDSRSFDNQGYAATSGYEYGSEPYIWYHTTGDTLGNCNMNLAADVTRLAVATLASLGLAPLAPASFSLVDAGSGSDLVASWPASVEPDLAGYKLLWGRTGRNYSDSILLGRVTLYRIGGLMTDTTYYATVVAVDSAGHESGASPEDSARPGVMPRAPTGLTAMPLWHGMALAWARNTELDLAGYNVYRRTPGSGYQRLNAALLTDTVWRDSCLLSDTLYCYACAAQDSAGNESPFSTEARGKPVTLDHGILLVDETRDGTGQPGNPSDEQQDAFYHALLAGYSYTDWDCATDSVPRAGDIGPYSTIVWHGDDYSQPELLPALPGLANNLSHGGRLWLVGWKPVAALMGTASYPFTFQPGQFACDYMHLAQAQQSARPDFIGADGVSGYPSVAVESAKAAPSLRGRLPYIDALLPRDAEVVLAYNSFSGDTFHGRSVGVRWLAGPGRTVFFGFPLYYMKDDEARAVARRVLDDLGEPYGLSEAWRQGPPGMLLDIGPSPAGEAVKLSFTLSEPARVRVVLYNAAGCRVRELVSGPEPAGRRSLRLPTQDLAAGAWFCRIETPNFTATRKFVVQR